MKRFAIIIPARFQSSRFPGKPLAPLRGVSGEAKPLIQRSWECATSVGAGVGVWVATDDARIAAVVEGFGGRVVMTDSGLRNGTERCAQAAVRLGLDVDVIVNFQGDAPLTPPLLVERLVAALDEDALAAVATPKITCTAGVYRHLMEDQRAGRVGGTTVVASSAGYALYFSKQIIPHVPPSQVDRAHLHVGLHLGLYAYRSEALADYVATPPSRLEELEGLEQLRFLETDQRIRMVAAEAPEWDCIELNNPEDVAPIERVLAERGIA